MNEFCWIDFGILIAITVGMCCSCVWLGRQMDEDLKRDEEELKKEILSEIAAQKYQIKSLQKSVKPVTRDNAIGRLTRMEAIGSKAISEASLNSARI